MWVLLWIAAQAASPARGEAPVEWRGPTGQGTVEWQATLSAPANGCARLDLMARGGVVETAVASCRPPESAGRIEIEPLQVGDASFVLARIVNGDRPTSSLELFGFLCDEVVRVSLGDDVVRAGPQYGTFYGGFSPYDRVVSVSGNVIRVIGPNGTDEWRVEGCSIERS
jgi:hypothetical protein